MSSDRVKVVMNIYTLLRELRGTHRTFFIVNLSQLDFFTGRVKQKTFFFYSFGRSKQLNYCARKYILRDWLITSELTSPILLGLKLLSEITLQKYHDVFRFLIATPAFSVAVYV